MANSSSDITMVDVVNFNNIKKKLKLGMGKLMSAQKWQKNNPDATEDDFMRHLLGLSADKDPKEYLQDRLNESELDSLNKFLNPKKKD